jgi:hypothetical protein
VVSLLGFTPLESQAWKASHAGIARFINSFLETIPFEATPASQPLLQGIKFAQHIAKVGRQDWGEVPLELHPDVVDGDFRPLRDPNAYRGLEDVE